MMFEANEILSNFNDFNKNLSLNSVNFSQRSRHRIDAKVPVMIGKVKSAQLLPNGDPTAGGIWENGKM